jgi:hypothetical protein
MAHSAYAVVIPTYNRATLIGETIESVLLQDLPAAEVAVVDDGSLDETAAVVATFGARVIYRRIEKSGVQVARNTGIAITRAPWIALCDSDDLWRSDHLQSHSALAASDHEIDFIFSNFVRFGEGPRLDERKFDQAPAGFWEGLRTTKLPAGIVFKGSIAAATVTFQPVFQSAMSFTRKLTSRVGLFDPRLRGYPSEDWEFTMRCLYEARVGAVPEPTVSIRRHSGNDSRNGARQSRGEVLILRYMLQCHPQAAAYRALFEESIIKRNLETFDSAFVDCNHPLAREVYGEIPAARRSLKMMAKHMVARFPEPTARMLNLCFQRARNAST